MEKIYIKWKYKDKITPTQKKKVHKKRKIRRKIGVKQIKKYKKMLFF